MSINNNIAAILNTQGKTEIGQIGQGLRQPIVNEWKSIFKRKLFKMR